MGILSLQNLCISSRTYVKLMLSISFEIIDTTKYDEKLLLHVTNIFDSLLGLCIHSLLYEYKYLRILKFFQKQDVVLETTCCVMKDFFALLRSCC